ncbi:MAG: SH3 domain-containing protein [Chloroflexales bacterium]|nr:SH3 domain-containing protein [Chloroflexales bacterium]
MRNTGNQPRRGRSAGLPPDEDGFSEYDPRDTDQFPPPNNDWSTQRPVNPDWRTSRVSTAPRGQRRRAGAIPSGSPQEVQIWLQRGGWKLVMAAAVIFVLALILVLAVSRGDRREGPLSNSSTTGAEIGSAQDDLLGQFPSTTAEPPTVAPAPPSAAFVVVNTGGLGLFLRSEPNQNSATLATLPDGLRVEQIGVDVSGAGFVWRNVRTPDGQEGWVAVDFLQPAQ